MHSGAVIAAFATLMGVACSESAKTIAVSNPPNPAACKGHVVPHQERTSDTVRNLDLTWGKRWEAGDVAFLDCLYDPTWHYVTPKGIIDKSHDLAQSQRFAAAHHNFKSWPIASVMVYLDGDFAASSGLTHSPDGKHVRRWTDYFMWDGARWHAVFSQATPVN
ncbi:MAG: nuclear transport factor 2 family protein [Candidatus Cybelea sp.]|jgi:hypothetical protein